MNLERDSRLGRFVIRQRIGTGGMGSVYRAFDTVLRREVAIKTILDDKSSDRDSIARFRREALSISQLDDPHIVKIIDSVEGSPEKDEPHYIVMELLRGQNLHSLIKKGPVEIPRLVDIMLQTCAAVGACHRRGFVHRDLKATNIFLTEYNQIETAKILDFGVAKFWSGSLGGDDSPDSEVTRNGMVFGTPDYLAPEFFRGVGAGPKTDQYALGILLYTALTGGKKPFKVDKDQDYPGLELWKAIVKGEHEPVGVVRRDVPSGLSEVVERAMHRDPARRFKSVHELGEALLPWASDRARLQWTGYFTSEPKPPPIHSYTIGSELVSYARGIIAQRGATASQAPTAGSSEDTSSLDFSEMPTISASPEVQHADVPTSNGPAGAREECSTGYIPLTIDDVSVVESEARTGTAETDSATTTGPPLSSMRLGGFPRFAAARAGQITRGPAFIVSLAVVGLIFASSFVILVRHRSPLVVPRVRPPAAIVQRKAAASERPVSLAVPPEGALPNARIAAPSLDPLKVALRSSASAVPEEPRKVSRPQRRRKPRAVVDENGIGIPSD